MHTGSGFGIRTAQPGWSTCPTSSTAECLQLGTTRSSSRKSAWDKPGQSPGVRTSSSARMHCTCSSLVNTRGGDSRATQATLTRPPLIRSLPPTSRFSTIEHPAARGTSVGGAPPSLRLSRSQEGRATACATWRPGWRAARIRWPGRERAQDQYQVRSLRAGIKERVSPRVMLMGRG